ncbi:Coenzyme F420 hydrogenase/dehydrogenase, beta subunit C-terminal domain [Nostoc spongiaeforme FACHB-130]|uniref:Coenzyme F420 hydrogenase/dehydrogenase, beta subunit C-terminal domain n=1 Tax=Nostoc spongiaeforme FACHB-130 TaxID=1357510 RepID=A0ABR8FXT0_9NOSO|nr:Coenzyme F420 hydrogenase/dehydrogenase, beta subunit C-terminal domain [Nostoc spongiaeforme]MBD2594944.1 Coenzyme F420 hydrogenase/dehydrogenase, beta subunit C-terminal domain [Nostoc spongiaeforme FACHB-130]
MKNLETTKLFETVVDGGYCIGCGGCASITDSPIKMKLDEYGRICASIEPSADQSSIEISPIAVCPFSEEALNEDQIAQEIFGQNCEHHNLIGYHLATYAGFVAESDFRERGSSGGMGTWIITRLLSENLVDGVIHVQQRLPSATDPRLFQYQLSTTQEEIRNGAKSRYYPIEISGVIQLIRDRPGRYAIVGIPCFIKAIRLLMMQDAVIAERIKFCVGLICGHLKSIRFAEMFAWQCGIEPGQLLGFDFRKKLSDRVASQYAIKAVGWQDGQVIERISPVRDLYGWDWGQGFFKYKACDYCDDVVAETADIVVGDAWLPQYVGDSQGTNVVVVRNSTLRNLIEQGITTGKLKLDHIDADEVARSQSSGFSHRREGLAYRLYLSDQKGEWRPPKRVKPQKSHLDKKLQKRQHLRMQLAEQSHIAFKQAIDAGKFSVFIRYMTPLVLQYQLTYPIYPLWRKTIQKFKKIVKKILFQ